MTEGWWAKPITAEEQRAKTPSATKRRTQRNEAMIAKGLHPFGPPLRQPRGETCGTCRFAQAVRMAGTYWKCEKMQNTHGPATDLRLKWPACALWSGT
jgi:hypothetical protein